MKESYRIAFNAFRSMGHLRRSKHDGDLEGAFIERIMLAVTEVNGCPLCSYAHTRMALESGMSMEEIQQMLGGSVDAVPGERLVAVLFAQHYARPGEIPPGILGRGWSIRMVGSGPWESWAP